MNILPAIFLVENLAVTRHQDRHRIREQQHPGGDGPGQTIGAWMLHSRVLQIDGIHQMMQRDMGITPAQAREQRRQ